MGNIYYLYCVLLSVLAFWGMERIQLKCCYLALSKGNTAEVWQFTIVDWLLKKSFTQIWFNNVNTWRHYFRTKTTTILHRNRIVASLYIDLVFIDIVHHPLWVFSLIISHVTQRRLPNPPIWCKIKLMCEYGQRWWHDLNHFDKKARLAKNRVWRKTSDSPKLNLPGIFCLKELHAFLHS